MHESSPQVVVLAGPNEAGKSTSAKRLLLGAPQVKEFVNADVIAQGLSAFSQERVAFAAGRIMLERLRELANAKVSFAFETTLATRRYAKWLTDLRAGGYRVRIVFLWLPSPDLAIARVADRVRAGGHDVPEEVIRSRYAAGLKNLFELYLPLADTWWVIEKPARHFKRLIASGVREQPAKVRDPLTWDLIQHNMKMP
jgi:predicted ABC-type ATPase